MAKDTAPTLHHLTSSTSFIALFAFEEASLLQSGGVQYSLNVIPRRSRTPFPELTSLHPLGRSPMLQLPPIDDSAKPKFILESRLIIEHISANYTNGQLDPDTPEDVERNRFLQELIYSTLSRVVGNCMMFKAMPNYCPFGTQTVFRLLLNVLLNLWLPQLQTLLKFLDEQLSDEKPWFAGAKIGTADLVAVFPLEAAAQMRLEWYKEKYPRLVMWLETMHERPAYRSALDKGGTFDLVRYQ